MSWSTKRSHATDRAKGSTTSSKRPSAVPLINVFVSRGPAPGATLTCRTSRRQRKERTRFKADRQPVLSLLGAPR